MTNDSDGLTHPSLASLRVDVLTGVLLITAALLKSYLPQETATVQIAYHLPRWAVLVGIQLELALGIALITGVFQQVIRRIALIAFIGFAAFSLYRLLSAHESCGCFGALLVPPWVTLLVDSAVVAALLTRRDIKRPSCPPRWALAAYILFATPLLASSTAHWLTAGTATNRLVDTIGSLTILEPEAWVGKPFPLTEYLEPEISLSQGECVVLLYHHDCPDCQAVLPKYEQLASFDSSRQVFVIEIPPYGPTQHPDSAAHFIRLSDRQKWFVQTPLEVIVVDGLVTRFANHGIPTAVE